MALDSGAFDAVVCTHWADGSTGADDLANSVISACNRSSNFKFLYDLNLSLEEKMYVIAKEMYGANKVELAPKVKETLERYTKQVKMILLLINQNNKRLRHYSCESYDCSF